jgi:hypothetical protein
MYAVEEKRGISSCFGGMTNFDAKRRMGLNKAGRGQFCAAL